MDGWAAGTAPWNNIEQKSKQAPVLGLNSWAVGSTGGESLLFYGQTLCPQQLEDDQNSVHKFTSSSESIKFESQGGTWVKSDSIANDVLGPRLVKDDTPVPVQVVDTQNHMVYTFVYDESNPQLGMELWSFSTDDLPMNIASAKNTTMVTRSPTTNVTEPSPVVLAPFVDVGSAVYFNGTIIVIGGGESAGQNLSSDDVDPTSGWLKMDRCWVYRISTGKWRVHMLDNLLALSGFEFLTSKVRTAHNAFVVVYNLKTSTWGSQFGIINETFIQKHGIAIVVGAVAGLIALLVIASIIAQLWRKYIRGSLLKSGVGGLSSSNKPYVRSKPDSMIGHGSALPIGVAAATRLSDATAINQQPSSQLPRASEPTVYDLQHPYNPNAVHRQQHVPLMNADALEQRNQDFSSNGNGGRA
ncbi:hypothetical protein BGZ65_009626 [Modicella reniformis]|uniref:Uncharacterized protein n=1 Tax=Modicella reniformis TaxID=1440133 RepID=A0A9P6LSX2_9FUNG|nr:hypothetical protein BGZ65_009626 [Modicella reniformis]